MRNRFLGDAAEVDSFQTAAVYRDVPVRMRDGVVLRCDVWRPVSPGPHPVLLQRLPYSKSDAQVAIVNAGVDPLRAVSAGYVVVIQDTRGRFTSGGTFVPFSHEGRDGADTIAWCAALPFSNGRVGMYGESYFGATQLLAAAEQPPALRAIAPEATGSEYYEGWTYQGGAFQLGFVLYWTLLSLAAPELERLPAPARAAGQAALDLLIGDPWAAYARLPLGDLAGLEQVAPWYLEWLDHPERDDFWRSVAPNERYSSIATPALHIGGWFDLFVAGTVENFVRLRKEAATEQARERQRLVIGPWAHAAVADTVGELEFGVSAGQPALDPTALHLRWFDEHLRDAPPADDPRVRVFLMGANTWLDADDWPLPSTEQQRWYLHASGPANTSGGAGRLSREPCPGESPADVFDFDPHAPVPTRGGATFMPGLAVSRHAGPRDQREVELRHDVLVYSSDPLEASIDVIGSVRATLSVVSSAPATDFTAKLVDVHLDGRAFGVCDGIREVTLGRTALPTQVEIELGPTAMRFCAGHRLRLEVSSSNFPRFARNPNTGGARTTARAEDLRPARQRVFHDASRPSFMTLPVWRPAAERAGTGTRGGAIA